VTDLVTDPANDMIMYAAIGNPFGSVANGFYRSVDGGATWFRFGYPPDPAFSFPTADVGRISLAIAPSAPRTLYAAVQSASTDRLLGVFKSFVGGDVWGPLAATNASCASQCDYDMYLAVDPTNANTVYFGGFNLYKSTDGGGSFDNIGANIHVDNHAFAFAPGDPTTIYAGNDGGLFVSKAGAAFASLNDGLVTTQFYPGLALNGSLALGGLQDNGVVFTSAANAPSPSNWTAQPDLACDGGFTAIVVSPMPPFTATGYAECQWGGNPNPGGPQKSDNLGVNPFNLARTGINVSDRAQFIPPLVMSPSTSSLYFGTSVVYKTTNSAGMWNSISPDLTNGGCCISTIAEAKSNGKVVYVGTGNGLLWMTPDGGTTWNLITGLPNRAITDIAVNPTNENNVFVTVSGFGNPGADGHVFMSINNGAKWTDISGTMPSRLPNIPVNAIVLDPSAPTTEILVGTDLGVYRTHDGGTTWTPFNAGLPNAPVLDLVYDSATKILAAATHGRGVWTAQMGAVRVTHDFNGDRLSDVLWYNTTNGLTVAWLVRCTTGGANPGCMSLSAPYDAADRADAAASPRAASSPATRACRSPG